MRKNPYLDPKTVVRFEIREAKTKFYYYLSQLLLDGIEKPEGPILDLGAGSLNSTLALAQKFRSDRIVAVDESAEMLKLGRIKVGHDSINDPQLADYVDTFKQAARETSLAERLTTICSDVLQLRDLIGTSHLPDSSFSLVVGNFIWHWLVRQDVEWDVLKLLNKIMKPGAILAINSSDTYITPIFYDMEKFSIYYNPLIKTFFDTLKGKKIQQEAGGTITYPTPPIIEKDSLITNFRRAGFKFLNYDEKLVSVQSKLGDEDPKGADTQELLCNCHMWQFPFCLDIFVDSSISSELQLRMLEQARMEAITTVGADMQNGGMDGALNSNNMHHICARFVFEKIGDSL